MNNREIFSEARFGMMLHWGLYTLLAGEYKGENMGGRDDGKRGELGEWAMSYFRIPVREYEKLAAAFNPIGFDAEEYVKIAKDAGMRYLVITSKHHEGFAMFKSDTDPYNVADATPFRRDPIAELAAACKKHGLKLGLYYSQELDWHEPDGGGYTRGLKNERSSWTNDWDFPDNAGKDFSLCFEKKIKPQVTELLTKYGELFSVWFDTPGVITPEQSEELYRLVKKYQPDCLVNSRIGNGRGDYTSLGDNQVPGGMKDRGMLFETAATLNDTWGYKGYDQNWKSAEEAISLLTRLASRNVNYLLNIGPDPLGRIPVAAQKILRQIGEWTRVNGEAVYGSLPSPYDVDLPSGPVTEKDGALYFVLNQPGERLSVPGILSEVGGAELLGCGKVPFTQSGSIVTVELPELAGKICPVVKLSGKGGILVQKGILVMPDGTLTLSASTAGRSSGLLLSRACDIDNWTDEGTLSWSFEAEKAGPCQIAMTVYNRDDEPTVLSLEVNGEKSVFTASRSRELDAAIAHHQPGYIADIGPILLKKGPNTVTMSLEEPRREGPFRFITMELKPEG